jgi:regulator of replication initiation timing
MTDKQNIFEVMDKLIEKNEKDTSNNIEEGEILEGLRKYIKKLVEENNELKERLSSLKDGK